MKSEVAGGRPWFLRHAVPILLAVGVAARLLPAFVNFIIGTDEGLFLTLGQSLAAGGAYTGNGRVIQADFPPGYPLFAAAVYRLGGGLELPALLNTVLVGGLLPLPVYWLASRLGSGGVDERAGLRAGLFAALLPALVLATTNFEAAAEPLYSLLLYTGWACLWAGLTRSEQRGPGMKRPALAALLPFLLAGLLTGAAHLVRWEGLVLGLIGLAAVVIGLRRRALLPALAFLAGLAAFAAPYALFLQRHTGSPINPKTRITRLHAAALEAAASDPYAFERYYYDLEDVLADPEGLSRLPPALVQNDTPLLRRYASNLVLQARLWLTSASLLTIVWIVPALAGLLALRRGPALFVLVLFAPLGAIPASVVDPRYFLPALPAAMILAAHGWGWIERRWSGPRLTLRLAGRAHNLPAAALLIAATAALFAAFDLAAPFRLSRPTEYRQAGLALRGQLPAGAHLLARKRQPAFYAGATWEWLPFGDLPVVLAYAVERDADYLFLDRRTVVDLRPQLAPLLDPANAPRELSAIYYDAQNGVVVYQINR